MIFFFGAQQRHHVCKHCAPHAVEDCAWRGAPPICSLGELATTPADDGSCPNYDVLFKKGVVTALNEVARNVAQSLPGVEVNDRYQASLPYLQDLQNPCDVHFNYFGYRYLAKHDWAFLDRLLSARGM